MGVYLKEFENHTKYENYINGSEVILPNVSICTTEGDVHYNPYVLQYNGFCKLILNNDETVELEGSGALTSAIISDYKSTLISAEIGIQCTSIGDGTFNNCSGLTSISIPSGITSIATGTFQKCTSLTSIDIPNSVTTIGAAAFYQCTSLTSIDIPNSVTTIGAATFQNCSGLTSIVIPDSVTNIDGSAFQNCSGLTSITINATTPPTLNSSNVFSNTNNCPIYVPSVSVDAYKSSGFWYNYIDRIQAIS